MLANRAVFASTLTPDRGQESLPEREPMKASYFGCMGYSERHKFPASWPVPPTYHDPKISMQSYQKGIEECEFAEELGFDWTSVSEHHYSGNRTTPNPGVMAASVAKTCKRGGGAL